MQTILDQFQQVDTNANASSANFHVRSIERLQRAYTALLSEYDTIWQAEAEGIVEITLRSRTQTLTVPVGQRLSSAIAMQLSEVLDDQLHALQQRIIREHEDLLKEGDAGDEVKLLELLLTPVDAQGMPVQESSTQDQAA
ncbi:hypothetical protein [Hymenobacter defluvii]|uniref:Uncharacterized protein n=1 Tax=Hymenobacter defluvii TaxID=2054411 RepID=A0ABS3THQ4_9BACT|nr:hypothetical protein [Hymenobacter defluvii]MBO3273204.1 hypothetical protein [Hymenobacter defluvii]